MVQNFTNKKMLNFRKYKKINRLVENKDFKEVKNTYLKSRFLTRRQMNVVNLTEQIKQKSPHIRIFLETILI